MNRLIADPKFPRTYDQVIDPIEKLSVPFDYAWSVVKTLNLVKKNFMPSDSYLDLHNRARLARSKRYNSLAVYHACKVLKFKVNKSYLLSKARI